METLEQVLRPAELGTAEFGVVVFSSWRDDPLVGLLEQVQDALARTLKDETLEPVPPSPTLAQTLQAWTEQAGVELFIILDQFEEYFLYHPQDDGPRSFAAEFARAVNQVDCPVSFVVSVREDALSKLDRFERRISGLFDNYLRVEHLDREQHELRIVRFGASRERLELAERPVLVAEPQARTRGQHHGRPPPGPLVVPAGMERMARRCVRRDDVAPVDLRRQGSGVGAAEHRIEVAQHQSACSCGMCECAGP